MNILKKLFVLIIVILIVLFASVLHYFAVQQNNEKSVEFCRKNIENFRDIIESNEDLNSDIIGITNISTGCYCKMYTRMLPRLLVYKVKNNNKNLEFIRPAHNEYVVPTIVLQKADAYISYGIADDIDFEYVISKLYKKNLYAFDCGVKNISKGNEYLYFKSECIGNDNFILKDFGQISSGQIHTFKEKLKELNLNDKKVYLKMDIAGAELDVIPSIIKYYKNLTGMSVVIKYDNSDEIIKVEKLLRDIEKEFVLVARNEMPGKKYCKCAYKNGHLSGVVSLTYINKEYVDKKYIPFKQSYNERTDYKQLYKLGDYMTKFDVSWILIFAEKSKQLFGKID